MEITLEQVKQHLNLDAGFTADDNYLLSLIEVAKEAVNWQLDNPSIEEEETTPATIIHAALLLIGELYNHREITTATNANALPKAYDYLLSIHRRYTVK